MAESARPVRPWIGLVAAALVVTLSVTRWVDDPADGYYEQALTRALVTFGLARALNGVISVMQGTEVAVHPAGLGVTFAPGEILDPLNDLVERFSWLMLVASTSLGIQKILMDISAWWGLRVLVAALGAGWVVLRLADRAPASRSVMLRMFLLALFLRLAMPLMVILNHALYDAFMARDYEAATGVIEETRHELDDLRAEAEGESATPVDGNWLDALGQWLDDTGQAMDVRARVKAFSDRLARTSEHLLKLAAVFALQTVLLPLLVLWAFARGLGPLVRAVGRPLPRE